MADRVEGLKALGIVVAICPFVSCFALYNVGWRKASLFEFVLGIFVIWYVTKVWRRL